MILCADTVYGPMTDLSVPLESMSLHGYDFWGLTESADTPYHLDGYFTVFRQNVLCHPKFRQFWADLKPRLSRTTYETVLTPFLVELGFVGNGYIKNYRHEDQLARPIELLKTKRMPFVRVRSLAYPETDLNESFFRIDKRLRAQTGYDINLISSHLAHLGHNDGFGIKSVIKRSFQALKNHISLT
jgi:lipopolysaccharide biosynthesis protein